MDVFALGTLTGLVFKMEKVPGEGNIEVELESEWIRQRKEENQTL